ncbi:MAG: hypothetical protein P9L97_05710 [Candidatus Tenebribacter davisii]|nr:hypothetical protein [Candidatus Tenebribacter davisii]
MAKIIPIGCITKLDTPVGKVLGAAKGQLEGVVLIGFDKRRRSVCSLNIC